MTRSIKREELYELVWSEPVSKLAARLGVSDVGLSKACRRHGIPLPPRGYWAKLEAGKKTSRPPLPPRGLGMPDVVGNERRAYTPWPEERQRLLTLNIPPPPQFPESVPDLTDRVRRLVGKVSIPKTFDRPHPLIAKVLDEDEERRQKQRASRYPSSWDAPLFDSPFERRRLRLVNALFLALERCDMKPSLRGKQDPDFSVRVGEEWVSFTLDHPGRARDRYRPRSEPTRPSTERLKLAIDEWRKHEGGTRVWEDREKDKLEVHIEDIVVALIVAGELRYREGQLFQHQWLVEQKARAIQEERELLEKAEREARERTERARQARVDRLLAEAAAFRQATDIREYAASVQRANAPAADRVPSSELESWASWALAQADEIDPVLSRRFLQAEDGGVECEMKQEGDEYDDDAV